MTRELLIVGTTYGFPDMAAWTSEELDMTDVDDDDVTVWNYREHVLWKLKGDSHTRKYAYSSTIMEGSHGKKSMARTYVVENVENDYAKLEDQWVLARYASPYVWEDKAMEILDALFEKYFSEEEAGQFYGQWERPEWKNAMAGYEEEVKTQLGAHWTTRLEKLKASGKAMKDTTPVRMAMMKLEWVFFKKEVSLHEWRLPLLSKGHLRFMTKFFEGRSDAIRLVSILFLCFVLSFGGRLVADTQTNCVSA